MTKPTSEGWYAINGNPSVERFQRETYLRFVFPLFETHMEGHRINGQSLYNGKWAPYLRNKIFGKMHALLEWQLHKAKLSHISFPSDMLPLGLKIEFHTIRNHGNIRMKDGKFMKCNPELGGSWDILNASGPWCKAFEDTLVAMKILPNDSIDYVDDSGRGIYVPVKTVEERKLVFSLYRDVPETSR